MHAGDSASCWAPQQEQSRYSASAAPAKDFAWRSAPCSADHSIEFLTSAPRICARHSAFADHVLHSSERCPPSRSVLPHLVAAYGGVLVRSDWPALTPALTEIRLFVLAECLSASGHGTTLNWNSWLFYARRQAHFLLEYHRPGPGGLPLGLASTEGLGISAPGRQPRLFFQASDSASR